MRYSFPAERAPDDVKVGCRGAHKCRSLQAWCSEHHVELCWYVEHRRVRRGRDTSLQGSFCPVASHPGTRLEWILLCKVPAWDAHLSGRGGKLERTSSLPVPLPLAGPRAVDALGCSEEAAGGSSTEKDEKERGECSGEAVPRQERIRRRAVTHSSTGPLTLTLSEPILNISSASSSLIQVPRKPTPNGGP